MNGNLPATPRVAEFFAGMGLVRMALEQAACRVVFANDISAVKQRIYEANFDTGEFLRDDIRNIHGAQVPNVEMATASFPCTDTSLAGNRAGLNGQESSMIREFLRILAEMGARKPAVVLLENVVGLATSQGGADLAEAIRALNGLEYTCDLVMVDARWFVPQSRPRVFVVASLAPVDGATDWQTSPLRPPWTRKFIEEHPSLKMRTAQLPDPPTHPGHLVYFVEHYPSHHPIWWDGARLEGFLSSLSSVQAERLESMRDAEYVTFATAYRRTRRGKAVWEIRKDDIAGCLRTGSGGSSRQALVEASQGEVRVRWMTAREYARLQGAPDVHFGGVTEAQARFALGDAVCVPAVAWLLRNYLPLLRSEPIPEEQSVAAHA